MSPHENTPDDRFQDQAPAWNPYYVRPSDEEVVVVCPICQKATDSLKSIDVRKVIFAWVFFAWYSENVVGCPRCARSAILSHILQAIPAANLLFPFYAIIYALQFIQAGAKGHSDPIVANEHRMTASQYFNQTPIEKPSRGVFYWVVVTLLSLLIGGIALMVIWVLVRDMRR